MNTAWRDNRLRIMVISAVVVLALVVAAVLLWPSSDGASTAVDDVEQGQIDAPAEETTAEPGDEGLPASVVERHILPMVPSDKVPTADGVAAQLEAALANPDVGSLVGMVIDPVTGEVLWEQGADVPRAPASTMKLLTAMALLHWADPDDRLTTTVVRGQDPGQIVLVGGGDVTLSAIPDNAPTVLPGGPRVADLADQVLAAGVEVTSILLDTSYWSGPEMGEGWSSDDITGTPRDASGYITRMEPLMVDADRLDADNEDSIRTGEPAITAGEALARALGDDSIPVDYGLAPDNAEVIAQVQSQPLSTLLAQSLERSDNVLSEALARQAAIASGAPPTFAGVSAAVVTALQDLGIDTTGLVVKDGSGMSELNRVPSQVLARVMALAVSGEVPSQQLLVTGLPLAGVSGTLAPPRFSQPDNEAGAGWVRAKTGSLGGTYALVGYVPDVDGRILVFAFNSANVVSDSEFEDPTRGTRPAQDALAAALRLCGCSG